MPGSARDERVDDLLARGLSEADGIGGQWLVTGGLPRTAAVLAARGAGVVWWNRFAGAGDPRPAPPSGPFAGAAIRPWRGSDASRMTLHLVAAQLAPDGELWAAASNDEGGRSLAGKLAEVLAEVAPGVPGRHARRHVGRRPRVGLRDRLAVWREEVQVELCGVPRTLASWPGLFAHGRLDPGTSLLLEHLPDPRGARVLDFACGAGAVGAALAGRGVRSLDLSDHDALAVHAASVNVPEARTHCADGVPAGGEPRWDLVVSNPPIHRGSERDLAVIEALIPGLRHRLAPGAEVRVVTQATVPLATLAGSTLGPVRAIRSDRRFTVWGITHR